MTEPNPRVRVALVDDDPRVREALMGVLSADPAIDVVGVAADGRTALTLARSRRLDVLILDIRMSVLDGLAVLQHLRRENNSARVLILTSFGESEYVRTAVRLAPTASC
jgi:DNA-binding NarL/FixJ family response regulator